MIRLPDAWYGALMWLFFASLGLIIPVGFGLLVVAAVRDVAVTFGAFTDGGQFSMYTAAMLTGTVYLIAKPAGQRLRFTEWFLWFSILALFLSGTLFTLATLFSNGLDIDPEFFRWPSVALALVSLGMAFVAVGMDNRRSEIDLLSMQKSDQLELTRAFRKIS